MGRVVYFFPSHVLIGCIGGIGAFVAKVGVEVTINTTFSPKACLSRWHLLIVVLLFEVVLRLLLALSKDASGKSRVPLLAPIYYCAITPMFYAVLKVGGVDLEWAHSAGYFFEALDTAGGTGDGGSWWSGVFDEQLLTIWKVIDFRNISWVAVGKSVPTLVSLVAFSLIHVPINIPAFAISTNSDVDMNTELKAHGYSNAIAGLCGGLQNYLCYANSVLYAKSGGEGKISSLLVAFLSVGLFCIGPDITSSIPRCMAGTLLLHVGIDLFLEGVYDSYGNFDKLEYAGVWLITVVMTIYGMSAALLAGIISALSTYAVQSVTYLNPVRGSMSAATLRSSRWNRSAQENEILENNDIGRRKIFVIQLHGHIFFGNVTQMTEQIKELLTEFKSDNHGEGAWIVIIDFSLVVGIDSSAAQAISKLKDMMRKKYKIYTTIFVTGSHDGFPCEFDLSKTLRIPDSPIPNTSSVDTAIHEEEPLLRVSSQDSITFLRANRRSIIRRMSSVNIAIPFPEVSQVHVCVNLDEALMDAEDTLIQFQDPTLIVDKSEGQMHRATSNSLEDEKELFIRFLSDLCPHVDKKILERLSALFHRQVYRRGDIIWAQSSRSDCVKIVIQGSLVSLLEDEAGTTEPIPPGAVIGELGLTNGMDRLSTVKCDSDEAILYSMEEDVW
eukprot:CAMPEP_0172504374 /NCGR_PEP_ID=MMETSP1066-20121228/178172_1 /TAXON_ID=671091 /ORGANISM="Coscinodiscus wailesii, Strain CCMP2513" /LENGTH=667 /DNA_ID=CAMNT_0013280547 /DNA_START=86 /DNA_END=2086 /DNA_ORIENTATION=-